jgi:hypothetical protein
LDFRHQFIPLRDRGLPARAQNLYRPNLDFRDWPGFVVHRHAESVTHPQRAWGKRPEVILHYCECHDAGVHDRIDGEHRKIAHFAAPANTSGRSSVVGGDCIFNGEEPLIPIQESSGGVTFAIRVHPRAKKNAVTGELGDALKLSLTSPPVEGRANEACVEFLAKLLKVPRSSVTIASGHTSRAKIIRVTGISVEEVRGRIV